MYTYLLTLYYRWLIIYIKRERESAKFDATDILVNKKLDALLCVVLY